MRPQRSLAVSILAVTAAVLTAAAPNSSRRPILLIREPELAATSDFRWSVAMQFRNPTDEGIYTDSLTCEAQDLDTGVTRGPRERWIPIRYALRQLPSLGTGDSASLAFSYTALYEKARLIMRYYSHNQNGERYLAADTVLMQPAAYAAQTPSVSFKSGGRDIEYYYARALGGDAAVPTVLLLHGDQSHARHLLPLASELTTKGYNVMAVSQPGYGRSGGPPDLAGPVTMRAIEDAIVALKHTPGVDSTRIAVWGIERGGTVAARLAMTRHDLAGAISTRGIYDLWSVARASKSLREQFASDAGRDSAAWKLRSPALQPRKLEIPLLVVCTANDPVIPSAQAEAFAFSLSGALQPAEFQNVEGADRPLPFGAAKDQAFAFLEKIFKRN